MTIKIVFIPLVVFLFLVASCDQGKVKNPDQCFGEWKMLDDPSHEKSFILKENGKAEFNNLLIADIAGNEEGKIPETGTWKLVSDGSKESFLEIWFAWKGGEYGQGGKLTLKKELEVWFTVGDPDDLEWKRFRLVKPPYNSGSNKNQR